jgi:hypothetical protein
MMVDAPKYPVSHEDRHLACQEEVDGPLQIILERATTHGWGTFETISAMEEVLMHLRLMYADHPHPNENPTSSNEGHAFVHGRGGSEKP